MQEKLYFIQSVFADQVEDSYEDGELGNGKRFGFDLNANNYTSLDQIIDEINYYFRCKYTVKDYTVQDINNYVELCTDILVDKDDYSLRDSDIEKWKIGEIKAYSIHLMIAIEVYEKIDAEKDLVSQGVSR